MIWKYYFLRKFPENPKIIEFSKCKPFNQTFWKFRGENQIEQEFSTRNGCQDIHNLIRT
jgi:hypothetical protein